MDRESKSKGAVAKDKPDGCASSSPVAGTVGRDAGTEAGVRRFDRMPTLAEIEGKPWVLLSHDVAAGTRYRLSPFPYDPSHLVLCTCGQFVGPPQDSPGVIGRSSSGQPDPGGTPASWRVDQVDGKYWLRADGALMPQFTISPFEWDPEKVVVCACGNLVGKPSTMGYPGWPL
jgi:hypothetical protein